MWQGLGCCPLADSIGTSYGQIFLVQFASSGIKAKQILMRDSKGNENYQIKFWHLESFLDYFTLIYASSLYAHILLYPYPITVFLAFIPPPFFMKGSANDMIGGESQGDEKARSKWIFNLMNKVGTLNKIEEFKSLHRY